MFRIFDVEYLRNGMRYSHNSFTFGIYSTKAIIWRFIYIIELKKKFPIYHEKSYAVEDVLMYRIQITFRMKISHQLYEISTKMLYAEQARFMT